VLGTRRRQASLLAAAFLLGGCGAAAGPAPSNSAATLEPVGATETATVVRIVDGDTIVIDRGHGDERLRYIGIDTPESVKPDTPVQPFAELASEANQRLVERRTVVLERDVSETDRFGRLLRYVWLLDGSAWTFVNLELVRDGFAHATTYPPDVRWTDTFRAAERSARDAGRGLWAADAGPSAAAGRPGTSVLGFVGGACDPAYPTVCIAPGAPNLDCSDITFRRFTVLPPDPQHFDSDGDGIGCEDG
jgi:micrococcal nuclease